VGFAVIEAVLNHLGLQHLNDTYSIAPGDLIWPACWFISTVNVFASFGFARELAAPKPDALPLVKASQPAAPIVWDADTAKRMAAIGQQVRRNNRRPRTRV
jgi:hypothetical protein